MELISIDISFRMRLVCGNVSQWGVSSVKLQMELEVLLEVHLQLQLSCEVESSSVGTEIGFNLFSFYLHFPCVYSYFNLGTISYFSFNLQHSLGTDSLFFILSKPFTAM